MVFCLRQMLHNWATTRGQETHREGNTIASQHRFLCLCSSPKTISFSNFKVKDPCHKVGHSMFLDLTYDLTQDMQKVKHFHNWDHAIYLIKNRISWINYCLPALFLPKASDFAIREPGIVLPARNGCQIWHLSQCRCKERIGRPVWLHSTLHEQPRRKNQIIESMPTTRYEWYRKIEIHHFL